MDNLIRGLYRTKLGSRHSRLHHDHSHSQSSAGLVTPSPSLWSYVRWCDSSPECHYQATETCVDVGRLILRHSCWLDCRPLRPVSIHTDRWREWRASQSMIRKRVLVPNIRRRVSTPFGLLFYRRPFSNIAIIMPLTSVGRKHYEMMAGVCLSVSLSVCRMPWHNWRM